MHESAPRPVRRVHPHVRAASTRMAEGFATLVLAHRIDQLGQWSASPTSDQRASRQRSDGSKRRSGSPPGRVLLATSVSSAQWCAQAPASRRLAAARTSRRAEQTAVLGRGWRRLAAGWIVRSSPHGRRASGATVDGGRTRLKMRRPAVICPPQPLESTPARERRKASSRDGAAAAGTAHARADRCCWRALYIASSARAIRSPSPSPAPSSATPTVRAAC